MNTIIRKYQSSDRSQVERCMQVLQDFERTLDPDMIPGEDMVEGYVQWLLNLEVEADGEIYVAEVDGIIAGFIAIYKDIKNDLLFENNVACASISDFVVLPEYRKRGIGSKLLEKADQYAKQRNISMVKLPSVLADNHVGREVYRKAGFSDYVVTLLKKLT